MIITITQKFRICTEIFAGKSPNAMVTVADFFLNCDHKS